MAGVNLSQMDFLLCRLSSGQIKQAAAINKKIINSWLKYSQQY